MPCTILLSGTTADRISCSWARVFAGVGEQQTDATAKVTGDDRSAARRQPAQCQEVYGTAHCGWEGPSKMNGFRHGMRSSEYLRLLIALSDAEPGAVLRAEQRLLTAARRTHPAYVELVELFIEVERQMVEPSYPLGRAVRRDRRKKHDDRSLKVIYNQ